MTGSMLDKGNTQQAVDILLKVIGSLQQDNERLTYHLATTRRALFGRRTEKLNAEELGQLVLALGGTEEQAAEIEPVLPTPKQEPEQGTEDEKKKPKRKRPNHSGRTQLSSELPRNVTLVPVPEDERNCIHCGAEMQCIGHIDHERVEFIPAQIVVNVVIRMGLSLVLPPLMMALLRSMPRERR